MEYGLVWFGVWMYMHMWCGVVWRGVVLVLYSRPEEEVVHFFAGGRCSDAGHGPFGFSGVGSMMSHTVA